MTEEEFTDQYHMKVVKPLGKIYDIPIKEYVVTATIFGYEVDEESGDDICVFGLKELYGEKWLTLKITEPKLEYYLSDFEVL